MKFGGCKIVQKALDKLSDSDLGDYGLGKDALYKYAQDLSSAIHHENVSDFRLAFRCQIRR